MKWIATLLGITYLGCLQPIKAAQEAGYEPASQQELDAIIAEQHQLLQEENLPTIVKELQFRHLNPFGYTTINRQKDQHIRTDISRLVHYKIPTKKERNGKYTTIVPSQTPGILLVAYTDTGKTYIRTLTIEQIPSIGKASIWKRRGIVPTTANLVSSTTDYARGWPHPNQIFETTLNPEDQEIHIEQRNQESAIYAFGRTTFSTIALPLTGSWKALNQLSNYSKKKVNQWRGNTEHHILIHKKKGLVASPLKEFTRKQKSIYTGNSQWLDLEQVVKEDSKKITEEIQSAINFIKTYQKPIQKNRKPINQEITSIEEGQGKIEPLTKYRPRKLTQEEIEQVRQEIDTAIEKVNQQLPSPQRRSLIQLEAEYQQAVKAEQQATAREQHLQSKLKETAQAKENLLQEKINKEKEILQQIATIVDERIGIKKLTEYQQNNKRRQEQLIKAQTHIEQEMEDPFTRDRYHREYDAIMKQKKALRNQVAITEERIAAKEEKIAVAKQTATKAKESLEFNNSVLKNTTAREQIEAAWIKESQEAQQQATKRQALAKLSTESKARQMKSRAQRQKDLQEQRKLLYTCKEEDFINKCYEIKCKQKELARIILEAQNIGSLMPKKLKKRKEVELPTPEELEKEKRNQRSRPGFIIRSISMNLEERETILNNARAVFQKIQDLVEKRRRVHQALEEYEILKVYEHKNLFIIHDNNQSTHITLQQKTVHKIENKKVADIRTDSSGKAAEITYRNGEVELYRLTSGKKVGHFKIPNIDQEEILAIHPIQHQGKKKIRMIITNKNIIVEVQEAKAKAKAKYATYGHTKTNNTKYQLAIFPLHETIQIHPHYISQRCFVCDNEEHTDTALVFQQENEIHIFYNLQKLGYQITKRNGEEKVEQCDLRFLNLDYTKKSTTPIVKSHITSTVGKHIESKTQDNQQKLKSLQSEQLERRIFHPDAEQAFTIGLEISKEEKAQQENIIKRVVKKPLRIIMGYTDPWLDRQLTRKRRFMRYVPVIGRGSRTGLIQSAAASEILADIHTETLKRVTGNPKNKQAIQKEMERLTKKNQALVLVNHQKSAIKVEPNPVIVKLYKKEVHKTIPKDPKQRSDIYQAIEQRISMDIRENFAWFIYISILAILIKIQQIFKEKTRAYRKNQPIEYSPTATTPTPQNTYYYDTDSSYYYDPANESYIPDSNLVYDTSSGYYYDADSDLYYDADSDLYYDADSDLYYDADSDLYYDADSDLYYTPEELTNNN